MDNKRSLSFTQSIADISYRELRDRRDVIERQQGKGRLLTNITGNEFEVYQEAAHLVRRVIPELRDQIKLSSGALAMDMTPLPKLFEVRCANWDLPDPAYLLLTYVRLIRASLQYRATLNIRHKPGKLDLHNTATEMLTAAADEAKSMTTKYRDLLKEMGA